jgi:hypothetical protein
MQQASRLDALLACGLPAAPLPRSAPMRPPRRGVQAAPSRPRRARRDHAGRALSSSMAVWRRKPPTANCSSGGVRLTADPFTARPGGHMQCPAMQPFCVCVCALQLAQSRHLIRLPPLSLGPSPSRCHAMRDPPSSNTRDVQGGTQPCAAPHRAHSLSGRPRHPSPQGRTQPPTPAPSAGAAGTHAGGRDPGDTREQDRGPGKG